MFSSSDPFGSAAIPAIMPPARARPSTIAIMTAAGIFAPDNILLRFITGITPTYIDSNRPIELPQAEHRWNYVNITMLGIQINEETRLRKAGQSINQEIWMEPGAADEYADRRASYWAVMPPSITSSEPVTKDDSSEAKNRTP